MNNIAAKIVLTSVLATSSTAVLASDKWEKESMDAWLDGKAETTLLLNSNLNSFDINTDVENQVVTLTGSVNNDLEKSLAEELVSGLDGVKKVNNELTVVSENKQDADSDAFAALTDSKITTIVKTRLLMDTSVSGTDIDVTTENKTVTLTGKVTSDAEHDLALSIANNTNDVNKVVDKLEVVQ
ncbi:BON domain-containing protein [Vibrio parahaemolyticus]|uniref:BON domain-containing protein n=1 Tax=Vibrio parahaemolyticus TaxID=670 RepID=UPI0011210B5A|nr:BON domain-containing protein [Vibrio parahaemolyticus]ELA9595375.1 BON domain-containing protein [Vibrio parahaemolyticus]MDF4498786.1 BON domain-containing protein [Vibrio parahaemolyticus]MDG3378872.1 BON domain-containing protein [Vibrio parahaemolyticus]TOA61650.1 transporter [Vibrio parahaemolyticus]